MRTFGNQLSITYSDLRMKKAVENQRKQKARKSVRKDAGKFLRKRDLPAVNHGEKIRTEMQDCMT